MPSHVIGRLLDCQFFCSALCALPYGGQLHPVTMYWSSNSDSDIWGSVLLYEIVTKCMGISPIFARESLKNWQKLINHGHLLWTFAFHLRTICNCLPSDLTYDLGSKVSNDSGDVIVILFWTQPLACMAVSRYVAGDIQEVLRKIGTVDFELKTVGVQIDHGKQRRMVGMIVFLASSGFLIAMMAIPLDERSFKLEYWFETVFITLHFSVVIAYAVILVVLTSNRYRFLDDAFRMYFPINSSTPGFLTTAGYTETVVCNEKEQLVVLRQIRILHDKLNDVVELINYCFSVQITFCVGLCFVIGVVCTFGLFKTFLYWDELYFVGIMNFIWYLYYLFFVLFFIAVGSKITREGKHIGVLIHKAINCSSSSAVISELNIFSQQLLHRSPVITCGLFVYDWTLLFTMIGATATYLIILIQFDVSIANPTNLNGTATGAS